MGTLFTILMALGCMDSPTEPHNAPTSTGSNTPGQVTDLIVTDSTGTAVTLSFTQVDDGSGNPADYAVRSHAGPMNWGAAEEVSQGTCAAPLQGNAIGSRMSCTIEGLSPDVAYTFQVAAFRGTFQAGAVYGALSNVVPDMEDTPEGDGVLVRSSFPCLPDIEGASCVDAGDWSTYNPNGRLNVVSDVLRHTLPQGQKGGTGGATMDAWDNIGSPTVMKEIYTSHRIRLVSGENDGLYEFYSGTNKLGFWGTQAPGGVPSDLVVLCHPSTQGAGTGQIEDHCRLRMVQQNNVSRGEKTTTDIFVDTWYHWEFQFVLNDPANNYIVEDQYGNPRTRGDGTFRWWQDGKLILELTDVAFSTDPSHGFYRYRWNPTWGGGSGHDDRTRTDYIEIDDLYVSGVAK